ncbi:hypothetical protein Zmor_003187 [Zophobas morio]|uniref:Uncharacterized protein n=1 Tax=Zophobas morio TaxID=2755281 RepID=A0AA38HND7_9CUCU|nr:hypothetical protein Zmor_003187 [Zophobas morio]
MTLLRRTLALAILALISTAATSPATNPAKKDDGTEVASLKWSFYDIATLSTAVLVVSVGFAALVSLFIPLFTYKLCYFFGICHNTLDVFNEFVLPRKVTKRSVDYVEPMLTTLVNAYEKYADTDLKKKSKIPRF